MSPPRFSFSFPGVVSVLVAIAAALAGALGVIALDANRQQSRAAAAVIEASGRLGTFANRRVVVDRYDATALQTIAALKASSAARGVGSVHEAAVSFAESSTASELQPRFAAAVGFPLSAAGKRRVRRESATFIGDLKAHGARIDSLAARRDRYGRRGGRVSLGLTLTAIAGAVLGLAAILGATRSGRVVLGTGALALLAAAAAGIWALLA